MKIRVETVKDSKSALAGVPYVLEVSPRLLDATKPIVLEEDEYEVEIAMRFSTPVYIKPEYA